MTEKRRPRQALAVGTLTARLTAKLARRKPAISLLAMIQNNWSAIAPEDFLQNAKPTHISRSPAHTTLTLTVTQAFAPLALHRTAQLLNNINAFLGAQAIQQVRLKQTSTKP